MRKIFALLSGLLLVSLPGTALAQDGPTMFQANLDPQNDTDGSGTVTASLEGTQLTVEIAASGLTPREQPHAQHIHGKAGGDNTCPTQAQDVDGDGFVNVAEGQATYGPILVSLTTEGDVSAASGVAVQRMPVADSDGNISYSRTFEVPSELADNLDTLHVVQHGIDIDDSGEYDGQKKSELDPAVPFEATVPSNCGELVAMPGGGVSTGAGGTAAHHNGADDTTDAGALTAAIAGLGAAGGLVALRRRANTNP